VDTPLAQEDLLVFLSRARFLQVARTGNFLAPCGPSIGAKKGEWKKPRGGPAGVASRPTGKGKRGYPRWRRRPAGRLPAPHPWGSRVKIPFVKGLATAEAERDPALKAEMEAWLNERVTHPDERALFPELANRLPDLPRPPRGVLPSPEGEQ
jgi:hypothetical protein